MSDMVWTEIDITAIGTIYPGTDAEREVTCGDCMETLALYETLTVAEIGNFTDKMRAGAIDVVKLVRSQVDEEVSS